MTTMLISTAHWRLVFLFLFSAFYADLFLCQNFKDAKKHKKVVGIVVIAVISLIVCSKYVLTADVIAKESFLLDHVLRVPSATLARSNVIFRENVYRTLTIH